MWMSIQGMYEYDPDVMSGFRVPEGVNRTDAINDIMLKCAELEIIYPDIDVLKTAITTWCNSEFTVWQKLYNTINVEYNPIWNVDANFTINDQDNIEDNRTIVDDSENSNTRNQSNTTTNNSSSTESTKGFNSEEWAEHNKTVDTGTVTDGGIISDSGTYDNTRTDNYNSEKTGTHTERRTGNIGVTATQDLLKKEREIAEFNLISYITESFKNRFCLLVY